MTDFKRIGITFLLCFPLTLFAQTAYFIDGYHGGIWGHYPVGYTSYIVQQLNQYPDWKINLEIEPETWDRVAKSDAVAYKELQKFLKDSSSNARIEYVNPAYAQPYMFNISGESIIRQFSYGMKMLREHFPTLSFKTYSSEEPCFTSALPQILNSFGYKYASLKNPNTCWGGYTRAYGKELVNWIGPDGSSILTSPRYEIENLKPGSTWETIANINSKEYITSAFKDGIHHPVGMTLQDAGWRFGPWLKGKFYKPSVYTTWKNYFQNIVAVNDVPNWNFTQEDVLTSLVWGSQVLQQLAQEVRVAENNIVQAEKIASINKLDKNEKYPKAALDEAWRNLLLSQHHDCWIVPYNGEKGDTWADKVKVWTKITNTISDSIKATGSITIADKKPVYLKIYNTSGWEREEWVETTFPAGMDDAIITDENNRPVIMGKIKSKDNGVIIKANVPAMGYVVYKLETVKKPVKANGATVFFTANGDCILETDLYKIRLDKANGGTIKSLIAKTLDDKNFVDSKSERKFNELRGNFYKKGGFNSSIQNPAKISVIENSPYLISVKIEGSIAGNPFYQTLTLKQGQKQIDLQLKIDWQQNEGIGEFEETNYQSTNLHKAFYNDSYKLLTLFPLALENQEIYKDAPFDVTESKLENTFYSTWDSIKNNIMLNWVDVVGGDKKYGMALFADHTTSYAHGENHPLGLTTQYAGQGLWGRNYKVDGPTLINYTLLPHKGDWQTGKVAQQNEIKKEPLKVVFTDLKPEKSRVSFIEADAENCTISSCTFEDDNLFVRVFNNDRKVSSVKIKLGFNAAKAMLVNLDRSEITKANLTSEKEVSEIAFDIPPFGIKTLKILINENEPLFY